MSKKDALANYQEGRMAVPAENHPLDYADFEGVIFESEYGGRRKPVSPSPDPRSRGKQSNRSPGKLRDELPYGKILDAMRETEFLVEGRQNGYNRTSLILVPRVIESP